MGRRDLDVVSYERPSPPVTSPPRWAVSSPGTRDQVRAGGLVELRGREGDPLLVEERKAARLVGRKVWAGV